MNWRSLLHPATIRRVMERVVLLDTGPHVSFLADGLAHHAWVVEQWKQMRPPFLTCEPVLTEAAFLLKRAGGDTDGLFALLERRVIRVSLAVEDQQADVRALMRKYRNRPMTISGACLVRLSEIHAASKVLTLDRDFRIYRRHTAFTRVGKGGIGAIDR